MRRADDGGGAGTHAKGSQDCRQMWEITNRYRYLKIIIIIIIIYGIVDRKVTARLATVT